MPCGARCRGSSRRRIAQARCSMRRSAWYAPCTWAIDDRRASSRDTDAVGRAASRRRALVGRPPARHRAAADGAGRRRQCRRALLQPRAAARALQHGGHAQGAAHRAPDHGLRVLFGHGPHPLLDHRRHLRLARSAVRRHRRRAHRSALRRDALPGSIAINAIVSGREACWSSSASTGWASATWSRTSISSAR